MNKVEKEKALKLLVQERRDTEMGGAYDGYLNISDVAPEFDNDSYGYEYCITPISKGACNVEASVMVILNDWISTEGVDKVNTAGLMKSLISNGRITTGVGALKTCMSLRATARTNSYLDKDIIENHLNMRRQDVYITNAFPFVKSGGMCSNKSNKAIKEASHFFVKQVEIVQPKLILILGTPAKQVFDICSSNSEWSVSGLDVNTSVLITEKFQSSVCFMPHPTVYSQNKDAWCGDEFKNRVIMSII